MKFDRGQITKRIVSKHERILAGGLGVGAILLAIWAIDAAALLQVDWILNKWILGISFLGVFITGVAGYLAADESGVIQYIGWGDTVDSIGGFREEFVLRGYLLFRYLCTRPVIAWTVGIIVPIVPAIAFYQESAVWPQFGDPPIIIERSVGIVNGDPFWQYRDPPLRYIPIVVLIELFHWIATPTQIVTAYSFSVEYLILPVLVYIYAVRVGDRKSGYISLFLLGLLTYVIFPSSSPVWTENGFWMYAYGMVPLMGSLIAMTIESRWRWSVVGICLGMTALTQFLLAAIGAVSVTLAYLYERELSDLVLSGVTSIIVSTPLLASLPYHYQHWRNEGNSRRVYDSHFSPLGEFLLTILLILALISALYFVYRDREWPLSPSIASYTLITGFCYILFTFVLHWGWYQLLTGYAFKFGLIVSLSITIKEAVGILESKYRDQVSGAA